MSTVATPMRVVLHEGEGSQTLSGKRRDGTGRLERYRRTVGGANNNIEIEVVEYMPQ